RTRPHPDRHPDPSQRHQPRTTGHPGPAPRSRGLGHRLTRPPTASSTSADEQHRTAQHHFWPTNHTGNPIQREHYISGVLGLGHGPVFTATGEQFLMATALDDLARFHHQD